MKIIEAFDPQFIADDKFVVVFSSLKHCPACVRLKQTINRMQQVNGIYIYEIDVDKYAEVAARYNVLALPTILFFKKGKVMSMLAGSISEMHLREAIEAL